MLSDDFIKSEMLAEKYIENITTVKKLLQKGNTEECLTLVTELELSMQVTLAIGELYETKIIN